MEEQNKSSNNFSVIWIIIVSVLITALVVGGGVYWWQKSDAEETGKAEKEEKIEEQKPEEEKEAKEEEKTEEEKEKIDEEPEEIEKPEETEKSPEPEEDKTVGWETYANEKYGFSFDYPKNFQLIENSLYGWLDYYIEDPIVFRVKLLQDIYSENVQSPEINLEIAKTEKTISQVLDCVKKKIDEDAKAMEDSQSLYYGADPPEIESIETITVEGLEMTKVIRYAGPGGPNPMFLEYYISHQGYIFVFSVNYSANCDPQNIGDCGATEKEILPVILSTFKFVE